MVFQGDLIDTQGSRDPIFRQWPNPGFQGKRRPAQGHVQHIAKARAVFDKKINGSRDKECAACCPLMALSELIISPIHPNLLNTANSMYKLLQPRQDFQSKGETCTGQERY